MSAASPADSNTGSRTRRFHNKSRHGCKGCKERRIKCDEGRPTCSNCIRRSALCEYDKTLEEIERETSPTADSPDSKPPGRVRKSRRRSEPPVNPTFTFVDVGESLARKRKRKDEDPEERKRAGSDGSSSPPAFEDVEVHPRSTATLVEAVEQALEKGQQLARIMMVSKQPPSLLGESEFLPNDLQTNNLSPSYFDGSRGSSSNSGVASPASTASTLSISRWQSSPSTGLGQTVGGVRITLQDYHLITTYRTFTCETFPYATATRNPWKALTFDLQFRRPYLYHTTLALTSAHLRTLQSVATPSVAEISHYVKGLSAFREALSQAPPQSSPHMIRLAPGHSRPDVPLETRALFATSALLGAYMWASDMTEIHSWLLAKFSMTVGTREIINRAWEGTTFGEFRAAFGDLANSIMDKVYRSVALGENGMRFPALEALATGQGSATLLLALPESYTKPAADDMDAPGEPEDDANNTIVPDIYDAKYAWVGREECPYYDASNGLMVVDIGSLNRLACAITMLESHSKESPLSAETIIAVRQLIYVWPGIACRELLTSLQAKDKRVYLLLAFYYAVVLRYKQVNTPSTDALFEENSGSWLPPNEVFKGWWLMKNPRLLLRGIVDWLGVEWEKWLEWPLKVLRDEEEAEKKRFQEMWEPAMEGMPFNF
ncbi:hypothetical protein ABW20_dc0104007 [Dactylellina cionopaga]|nr:hypothetical protein ABW20_dc0104007 [Dactylellina cionopaga]